MWSKIQGAALVWRACGAAGDLNSLHDSAVYEFLQRGTVQPNHPDLQEDYQVGWPASLRPSLRSCLCRRVCVCACVCVRACVRVRACARGCVSARVVLVCVRWLAVRLERAE